MCYTNAAIILLYEISEERERERETERYIKRWMEFVKKYQNIFVLCYRFVFDNLETKFPIDVQSKCSLSFRVIIH